MKKMNWKFLLVFILISLSVVLYFIHFIIYDNAQYIFNGVLARIAFVPIQGLLIALVLNRLLTYHEKRTRKNYPYLFSHAMRTNLFDQHFSPIFVD